MAERRLFEPADATAQEWEEAVENVQSVRRLYLTIPAGIFGATFLQSLLDRYDAGDRSQDLFESMMSAE